MKDRPIDEIRNVSVFSDLDDAELATVFSLMRELSLATGETLFREGDSGREMFVILEGKICVSVATKDGGELCLAEIGEGAFIGEMSLIEDLPRSATCKGVVPTTLLGLNAEGLRVLMDDHSAVASKILHRMLTTTTSRLTNTSALLSDMVQWGEKARLRVITDEFTGLFNRRFLDDAIVKELRKANTGEGPLALAMVDLDRFGSVNKRYGEAFGNEVIYRAAQAFKESFRKGDILSRYGGDEFTFLLPNTGGDEALKLCKGACAAIEALRFPEQPDFRVTASIGVAVAPELASTPENLAAMADKALYAAKEGGRNRAELARKEARKKKNFATIAERNRTFERILAALRDKKEFLIVGHELPDEDCVSSLVAMALLVAKFDKTPTIYIRDPVPSQLSFLMNICAFNKIPVVGGAAYEGARPDAVFVLDTPKPDMIAGNPDIAGFISDPSMPVIEIDHHLSADASLSGTDGLCLVMRASSTCEILTFLCLKLSLKKDLMAKYGIEDLFARNLVLSLLTGIIGDTHFGLTVKTNRDRFIYNHITGFLSVILKKAHRKNSKNYSTMVDISNSIHSLSIEERDIYQAVLDRSKYRGNVGYVALDAEESTNILGRTDYAVFVKVIKSVTDQLSERSGAIGLTAYYDLPEVSNLVQFRARASRNISNVDLRGLLTEFGIDDGGGHPGAIGFRIQKGKIKDYPGLVARVVERLDAIIRSIEDPR